MQIDRLASGLMDYFMFYTSAVTRKVGTEDVTDGIVGSPAIRTQKVPCQPATSLSGKSCRTTIH